MDVKFFLCIIGTAAIGYFSYDAFRLGVAHLKTTAMNADPAVFPFPRHKAEEMLLNARTTLPRRDGDGNIEIWAAGLSPKGVALKLRYAKWAPIQNCQAAITRLSESTSRIEADCGSGFKTDSAMAKTQDELRSPMFEEHIAATLNRREFNRSRVDMAGTAAVFRNLEGMQREALDMYAKEGEMRRTMR